MPAGRPKGSPNKATADVKEAARKYTAAAVGVLAKIMNSDEQPAAARVSAASAILDRGYGKPTQAIDHGGELTVKTLADFYAETDEPEEGDA